MLNFVLVFDIILPLDEEKVKGVLKTPTILISSTLDFSLFE